MEWRMKRREQFVYEVKRRGRRREQSRLSISLTSGCCTVGSRKSSKLGPEVHVVHARGITNGMVFTNANKHFYQLQNDSPARGCLPPTRLLPRALPYPYPSPPHLSPIYRATSLFLPSFYTSTTNFWSPAFPCNLENDRAEPRASQIFDTRRLGERKEKDAVFRTRPSGWRAAAVDGNGNRGTKRQRWIQSWIGGAKGVEEERGGGGARTGLEAGLVGD